MPVRKQRPGKDGGQPILMWFRRDLRLADNPALSWATRTGRPVIPVFILDDDSESRPSGGASRWWLYGSLHALRADLKTSGSRLTLRRGVARETIAALAQETGASTIVWNRLYDPEIIRQDAEIQAQCEAAGVGIQSFNAALLLEPWTIQTGSGSPYRVFTPFWRRCLEQGFALPETEKPALVPPASWPATEALDTWNLRCHNPDWAAGFRKAWRPGEEGARQRLEDFLRDGAGKYATNRDAPGKQGTSRLSPHLHFGEIGPRQIVAALGGIKAGADKDAFLRQIGWREFCHHLLFHNPEMERVNIRREFDRMPWRNDPDGLRRWQRGQTGYPLVDAGMRELWTTGWMHNRVRMIAASFLTKHLLIDWRHGADWFLDTLVDADLANNSAGWQWTAGCGADAAPYFRIFNPVAQSRRFDAAGEYVRTWVPELRRLPGKAIHAPWQAPPSVLDKAGVRLGENYPYPIVDHAKARRRALDIYRRRIRGVGQIENRQIVRIAQ